jgi:hypothetical protein
MKIKDRVSDFITKYAARLFGPKAISGAVKYIVVLVTGFLFGILPEHGDAVTHFGEALGALLEALGKLFLDSL